MEDNKEKDSNKTKKRDLVSSRFVWDANEIQIFAPDGKEIDLDLPVPVQEQPETENEQPVA
jgi:hypothetical protein